MLQLTEPEIAQSLLNLEEIHRREGFSKMPVLHRALIHGLGQDELRLLWFAGQKDASHQRIAEQMGWSRAKVADRTLKLKKKLRQTRKENLELARQVAVYGANRGRL